MNEQALDIREGYKEKYGFHDDIAPIFKARRGLNREVVAQISDMKGEPKWMRDYRLKALEIFEKKPMPNWGGDLSQIDFQDIYYYLKPAEHQGKTWDDVPEEIKKTFDRLGIPEAEKKFLSGVKAQFESEVIYGSLKDDLSKKGVLFTDLSYHNVGVGVVDGKPTTSIRGVIASAARFSPKRTVRCSSRAARMT